MRLFNLLKTAFTKLGIIDDFFVERGTSGIWTYRKWNSGTAECWNTETFSFTGSTAYGALMGGYYAQLNNPSWGAFPFTFISKPVAIGWGRLGTGGGFLNVYAYESRVNTISCIGNQNTRTVNDVSMYIIGTWK